MPITEELSKAITDYYKLKEQYEDKINRQKSRILKNESLTLIQKRKKLKQLVPNCIICKNTGGTIFSNKDGILSALCGSDNPCKLNIKINRGNYVNVRTLDIILAEDLEKAKTEIIKTKLDVLFDYTGESDAIKKFNKLRPELKTLEELKFKWQKQYLNVVDNQSNKAQLNNKQGQFYIEKQQLKNLGKQYGEIERPGIITDMVEKYISTIEPLTEEIRSLKYKYISLECEDGSSAPCKQDEISRLVEEAYTLYDLEVDTGIDTGNQAGILSNIIPLKT